MKWNDIKVGETYTFTTGLFPRQILYKDDRYLIYKKESGIPILIEVGNFLEQYWQPPKKKIKVFLVMSRTLNRHICVSAWMTEGARGDQILIRRRCGEVVLKEWEEEVEIEEEA